MAAGRVSIVGAGPGDVGLLTLKGLQRLQEADVVLYDELLDRRLLVHTRDDCERIYVGKKGGRRNRSQEEIDDLLVDRARTGRRVVRLKGGDPCIFGRGGEEALFLAAADVPFEIVPGVSAASAVPIYAGFPLTHRGLSASAVLVTGHEDPHKPSPTVDWQKLARLDSTLVIFMGLRKLDEIADLLLTHGRPPDTPVAVIERGTYATQRTATAELRRIAAEAERLGIASPALIVVGPVVGLRPQLNWFEGRPLSGKRVLVTRRPEQAGPLCALLEEAGAQVDLLPLIEIALPADCSALDRALERLSAYGWAIFTSPNAVDFFFARLHQRDLDARAFAGVRIAAIGTATADRLRAFGIRPDLLPEEQSQEGLIAAFAPLPISGEEILFPLSSLGRDRLLVALQEKGARVDRVTAYENRPPDPATVSLPDTPPDLAVFASPSAVRNLFAACGEETARQLLADATIACIGPTTAGAVEELDLTPHILPAENSISALFDAILAHYEPPA